MASSRNLGSTLKELDYGKRIDPRWSALDRLGKRARSRRQAMRTAHRLVEALEDRRLLATLPLPTVASPVNVIQSNDYGFNSPSVAYNPLNPMKLVSVYVQNGGNPVNSQSVFVRGSYSIDGGASWAAFDIPLNLPDPVRTDNGLVRYHQATEPTVAFDRANNFYITYRQHASDNTTGAIVLQKYEFSGTTPASVASPNPSFTDVYNVIYAWATDDLQAPFDDPAPDAAWSPTLAVNSNVVTYTDPDTGITITDSTIVTDPVTGNPLFYPVYVAFATNYGPTGDGGTYNPNSIKLVASVDGGNTFTAEAYVNSNGNRGRSSHATPRMVVSQGTFGGTGAAPGQLTIVWDDFDFNDNNDAIKSNFILSPGTGYRFEGTVGPITDAAPDPNDAQAPHIEAVTDFPLAAPINITNPNFRLTDLDVTVAFVHPDFETLRMELVAPGGTVIPLFLNHRDQAGDAINNAGFGGNWMGIVDASRNNAIKRIGTIFDQEAPRAIDDGNAQQPWIGRFRPEPQGGGSLADLYGRDRAAVNGQWILRFTDYRENTNVPGNLAPELFAWSITMSSNFTVDPGNERTVATTNVRGDYDLQYALAPTVSPDVGISAHPVIASDNTLGSFSPYQGKLYVSFVRRVTGGGWPADDTDIYLASSTDGGQTWTVGGRVNNDAYTDGFSGADRPQFMPEIAVDQATGTLVLSWLDTRHDAARARVANYIATSIDGGLTFGPQTYISARNIVTDYITGQQVVAGPLPSNQSSGFGGRDATFGYGVQQGLVVFGGNIDAVYAGNTNGGNLRIINGSATIAAGPRVVSGTSGQVLTVNRDGLQQLSSFQITFDRPVNPATFDPSDVTLTYRDVNTPGTQPGIQIPIARIEPLAGDAFGVYVFEVFLAQPQTAIGTYSYTIGPNVADRVRSASPRVGDGAQAAYTSLTDTISVPMLISQDAVVSARVRVTLSSPVPVNVKLVSPAGTEVVLAEGVTQLLDTWFSDAATRNLSAGTPPYTGTFKPKDALAALAGEPVQGDWTLVLSDPAAVLTSWSMQVVTTLNGTAGFDGNPMDQNSDGSVRGLTDTFSNPTTPRDTLTLPLMISGPRVKDAYITLGTTPLTFATSLARPIPPTASTTDSVLAVQLPNFPVVSGVKVNVNITHPDTSNLTLILIAPNGQQVLLADGVGGPGAGFVNTVFDDDALTPISGGAVPFTGSFQPVQPLGNLLFTQANGNWRLRIINDTSVNVGQLVDWSLELTVPRFHFPDTTGDNPQVPRTVPPQGTGGSGVAARDITTSTINVNTGGLNVANVQVYLNITHTRSSDLVIRLFAPNGDEVLLSNNRGGTGQGFINTHFTDDGLESITTAADPFTGSYRPETPFSNLAGIAADGAWRLVIEDTRALNAGTLTDWYLRIDTSSTVAPAPAQVGLTLPLPSTTTESELNVYTGGKTIVDVDVHVNLTHTRTSDLILKLVAPDGREVLLSNKRGALADPGQGYLGTIFDDEATVAIADGVDPFNNPANNARYRPEQALRAFNGLVLDGTWKLLIEDSTAGESGQLVDWTLRLETLDRTTSPENLRLNTTVSYIDIAFDRDMDPTSITPESVLRLSTPIGSISGPFTITPNPLGDGDPDPAYPRTYRIGFPTQTISGSYTVVLSPTVRTKDGLMLDTNLNAGLDVLRSDAAASSPSPKTFPSGRVSVPLGSVTVPGVIAQSTITIPADQAFTIQSITVQLDALYSYDPNLRIKLIPPVATGISEILLVDLGTGKSGTQRDFINTIFDDAATTMIENGGAPFFGRFKPSRFGTGLSVLNGKDSAGVWTLQIYSDRAGYTGTLNNWSLTLVKALPGTGIGEPVADQATAHFRIFTMDPTNAQSHGTWTPVGPAAASGNSGRIGGLAVDPSDPTGNTMYVAGASGGVWKTTNFLTTEPNGPTYVPLTDFGPTYGINMGGIAVFPRNNDTRQSIVIAATGEGDTGTPGVGFLISLDGGATWNVYDSTNNVDPQGNLLPINDPRRDHAFVGNSSFKVIVDPRPTPSGEVIIYAAMSGPNGGIWRSFDTGKRWTRVLAGTATDVVLDPNSGYFDALSNPTGNLDIIYAGMRGQGVYMSPNRGDMWTLMLGGQGKPLFRDNDDTGPNKTPIDVDAPRGTPTGEKGRIVLGKPALTGNPALDVQYQGWLYAVVITGSVSTGTVIGGTLDGLYMTKDFGQNWTKVALSTVPSNPAGAARPTNDYTLADYPLFGTDRGQGNYDVSMAVDPNNPNVVYIGGKSDLPTGARVIRVDTTFVHDPHSTYFSHNLPDGGAANNPAGPAVTKNLNPIGSGLPLKTNPFINYIPKSTVLWTDFDRLTNTGAMATWTNFGQPAGGNDHHRMITFVDPTTGGTRLVFGNDHTISTGLDINGQYVQSIGNTTFAYGNRSGNIQTLQFYYGAVQPSSVAAQIAGAMFYGHAQDDGAPYSVADPLTTGTINWVGPNRGDSAGVAVDPTGSGTIFQYHWPCCGGGNTDFFQVNGVPKTYGLVQAGDNPAGNQGQWPYLGTINFAVNPIDPRQILISSSVGRVFATANQGDFWLEIGKPAALGNSQSLAMAFGAPQPGAPTGGLNQFLYVGTLAGRIYVTFTGGGTAGDNWINLSAGLDGSAVQSIVTNPLRGSREAYAVTRRGVYHMVDAAAANATWVNITSNLFSVTHDAFLNTLYRDPQARYLTSMQVDWRYIIPDDPRQPEGPSHPVLYVGGEGGVYRSLDDGRSWHLFPDDEADGAPRDGGYLPVAQVTDLDLALGDIDPTTGMPLMKNPNNPNGESRGLNLLTATTYGRGTFAIRLSPLIIPGTARVIPQPPDSNPDDDKVNFIGWSQQTGFGNVVRITIVNMTDPNNPIIIGGYDPNDPTTWDKPIDPNDPLSPRILINVTDHVGRFDIELDKNKLSGTETKIIGVYASDESGAIGQPRLFTIPGAPARPGLTPETDTGTPGDGITSILAPVILGTAGPNLTITVYLDGGTTPLGTTTSDANGVYTFPLPVLTPGAHTVFTTATDSVGFVSPSSDALTIVIDTTAPVVAAPPDLPAAQDTGISDTDNITRTTAPTLVGATEPGARVDLIVNGVVIATVTAAVDGNYTFNLAPLADGTYNVKVRATDGAGNVSADSPQMALIIDTTAPVLTGRALNVVEAGTFNDVVATFTDTNGLGSAAIDWDDGQSGPGTIAATGPGAYAVSGTHSWPVRSNRTLGISVTDAAGNTASTTSSMLVYSQPVNGVGGYTFTSDEGLMSTVQTVATFTDPGSPEDISTFSAIIDWGDGQTSTIPSAQLGYDPVSGVFTVADRHLYVAGGFYTITVTLKHSDAPDVIVTSSAAVSEAAPVATGGYTVTAIEGSPSTPQVVATFTDPGGPEDPQANYTTLIDWGDGKTSEGTVTFDANSNTFSVLGSHVYDLFGTYTITVSIRNDASPTTQVSSTANVSNPAVIPTGGYTITGVENSTTTIQTVATFIDPGGPRPINEYSATIDWGNGATSPGTITYNPSTGVYTVSGSQFYLSDGTYPVITTIRHSGAADVMATSTASIGDTPVVGGALAPITAQEGAATGVRSLAWFADQGGPEDISHYAATINWGDGQTSPGTIVFNFADSTFQVRGNHIYTLYGTYTITISVTNDEAAPTVITTSAIISNPAVIPMAPATPPTGTEGSPLTGVLTATFVDPGGAKDLSEYSATISWGDGQTSAGTITYDAVSNTFSVRGDHTYLNDGTYELTTTIRHVGAPDAAVSYSVSIAYLPITLESQAVSVKEGKVTATVAKFNAPGASASNFTAVISWGDGTKSEPGVITDLGDGRFAVKGTHTFADGRAKYRAKVVVTETGRKSVQTYSSVTVNNVAPTPAIKLPSQLIVKKAATFTISAKDPSSVDTSRGFTYTIDWGDGTGVQTVNATANNGAGVKLTHTYTGVRTYTIKVTAKDKDGAVGTILRNVTVITAPAAQKRSS